MYEFMHFSSIFRTFFAENPMINYTKLFPANCGPAPAAPPQTGSIHVEKFFLQSQPIYAIVVRQSAAGVVQWQNVSFPSWTRGFDSLHLLQNEKQLLSQLLFILGFSRRRRSPPVGIVTLMAAEAPLRWDFACGKTLERRKSAHWVTFTASDWTLKYLLYCSTLSFKIFPKALIFKHFRVFSFLMN